MSGLSDPATWVDAYGDRLFRYALSRVRDPRAAEDLLQETLLTAFKSREKFRGESSELTWLTGILRLKVFEHYRRQSREAPLAFEDSDDREAGSFVEDGHWRPEDAPAADWAGEPQALAESSEFSAALRACLDALAPLIARAFVLREMEGVEHRAAAEALGVPPAHLAVLLYRARMRLRRCLERGYFAGRAA